MATAVNPDPELKWLMEQSGLTDSELNQYSALLGDAKFKSMLIKIRTSNEQASTDRQAAEQERLNLEKKLSDEIYPEVRKVTQDSVRYQGQLAQAKAELEAAKQYGIVPGSIENTSTATTTTETRAPGSPDPSQYVSRDDFGKLRDEAGMAVIQINDISAEHFQLTGQPLSNAAALLEDLKRERALGHNDVNLRTVWERKFDIPKLRTDKAQAEKQKELDAYAETKLKDYREKHSEGSPTSVARESRFSTYKPDAGQEQKPWQRDHQKRAANGTWRQASAAKLEKSLVH